MWSNKTQMNVLINQLSAFFKKCLDFFYPPTCLVCLQKVEREGSLCLSCWPVLKEITHPFCTRCSVPLEIYTEAEETCGNCLASSPLWGRVRAVYIYNAAVRKMVLRFKAHRNLATGLHLARLMHAPHIDFIKEHDLIIPVPLHWRRLVFRGFNQVAVMVKYIGKWTKIPIDLNVIKRKKHTSILAPFGAKERAKILENSFIVPANKKAVLKGKSVLLVDDVMSSGSTIKACIKVLKQYGVKEVDVLVLSRPHLNKN